MNARPSRRLDILRQFSEVWKIIVVLAEPSTISRQPATETVFKNLIRTAMLTRVHGLPLDSLPFYRHVYTH